jgi:hypothetical protein
MYLENELNRDIFNNINIDQIYHQQILTKETSTVDVVAHACKLSSQGGRGGRIRVQGQPGH